MVYSVHCPGTKPLWFELTSVTQNQGLACITPFFSYPESSTSSIRLYRLSGYNDSKNQWCGWIRIGRISIHLGPWIWIRIQRSKMKGKANILWIRIRIQSMRIHITGKNNVRVVSTYRALFNRSVSLKQRLSPNKYTFVWKPEKYSHMKESSIKLK